MARRKQQLLDRLPFLINRVGSALAEAFATEALATRGLSIPIYRVLAVLADRGPMRQVDVIELTSIQASTMSRLIGRIVSRGWALRQRSPSNDREVTLRLTPKGRAVLEPLRSIARTYEDMAVTGISSADLDLVRGCLRQMHENIVMARRSRQRSTARRQD